MSLSTVMMFVLITGMITVIACVIGLISDCKKHRIEDREMKRKNLTNNTVNTILTYRAKQESAAMYYRRRA